MYSPSNIGVERDCRVILHRAFVLRVLPLVNIITNPDCPIPNLIPRLFSPTCCRSQTRQIIFISVAPPAWQFWASSLPYAVLLPSTLLCCPFSPLTVYCTRIVSRLFIQITEARWIHSQPGWNRNRTRRKPTMLFSLCPLVGLYCRGFIESKVALSRDQAKHRRLYNQILPFFTYRLVGTEFYLRFF